MTYLFRVLLTVALLFPAFAFAQNNLITNGSFESYKGSCPTGAPNGALVQEYNWRPSMTGSSGPLSVDLFCGGPNYSGCAPGPNPRQGSDGAAYAGFHTRILASLYNESFWQQLQTPLTAGHTYTISFDLMTCQSSMFTTGKSDMCVFASADSLIPQCPSDSADIVKLVAVPFDSLDKVNWKHHSYSFVAPPDCNVLAFSGGTCYNSEIYYYIDNIVLTAQEVVTGVTTAGQQHFSVSPNPFTNSITINHIGEGEAELFNALGVKIHSIHLSQHTTQWPMDETLPAGVYFLRVNDGVSTASQRVIKL